jgi:ABC-type Fe3+ transport system substrate-binding protein
VLLRLSIVGILLAAVLIAPFALRPDSEQGGLNLGKSVERLVIITPHNESIQSEFARAFATHMKEKHERTAFIDWRQPGGTSEIAKFLQSEYASRFEQHWKKKTGLPFSSAARNGWTDGKLDAEVEKAIQRGLLSNLHLLDGDDSEQISLAARALFLQSDIGVGIDLFFGGGAYDFGKQAFLGNLVSLDTSGKFGPAALAKEKPEWFSAEAIPAEVSGEPFRDDAYRWVGTVLSAFGICYNKDVVERLGMPGGPRKWEALADPRLQGQIALADPTKSGSTTKAFEMLIQERIQRLINEKGLTEQEAVRKGWNDSMQLILKISANSRYFTDSAAKVPRDVAQGDAAAGMCIDFYGRTFNEIYLNDMGESHVHFVMPRAGSSISADPIGMMRGAPNPELAHRFVEFLLSLEGQKVWNFRPGAPGGPRRFALRRPPIRKDFYTAENRAHMADPDVNLFELAEGFSYRNDWTGHLFASLRFVIKCACIDPHDELQEAWSHLINDDLPTDGMAAFENIEAISYNRVLNEIAPVLKTRNKVAEVALARRLSNSFRNQYETISAGH